MFRMQVPNNHEEAMHLDEINGDTSCAGAEFKETGEMDDIGVFCSLGHVAIASSITN